MSTLAHEMKEARVIVLVVGKEFYNIRGAVVVLQKKMHAS
jgi:hypothetical protein